MKVKGIILEIIHVRASINGQDSDSVMTPLALPNCIRQPFIASMYRADLQYTLRAVLGCALCRTPQERDMHARLLVFPARRAAGRLNLFAMIRVGSGNAGGAVSNGVLVSAPGRPTFRRGQLSPAAIRYVKSPLRSLDYV